MFEEFLMSGPGNEGSDFIPIFTMDDGEEINSQETYPDTIPLLALKNTVLYPGVVIPITVGRDKSIKAIQKAYENDRIIGVISQKDGKVEVPTQEDLFETGTVAKIVKLLKMPDGTTTAILQGRRRFKLIELLSSDPILSGNIKPRDYQFPKKAIEFEAQISTIRDLAKQIIELSPNIPSEAIVMIKNMTNNVFLINFIASNLNITLEEKQGILEEDHLKDFAQKILHFMHAELQLLELKDQIENKVRVDIEKAQRDYFLTQQLKTIQEELGQGGAESDVAILTDRSRKKKWGAPVAAHFEKELSKLRRTNPQVAEYGIILNYLELMLDLPWENYSKDNFDLKKVKEVLDKDHYGLEDVKNRILEHLAVLKLKGDMKAPIICLVGPPGVGKTSLGKSIATALKRKFVRMSLGGLHDEAEIRGHRKTYIGAMPGRIIQSMKKATFGNPVFILDEIDKIGKDFRGDPSSALLEVLDPEQNSTFYDNYLEQEYDLSKVLFIATANSLSTIQPALLDRVEIIQIGGYSTEEKIEIAKQHLIPEQRVEHGLQGKHIKLNDATIRQIIEDYTRESGVRSLDRKIAGVMRGVAKMVAMDEKYTPALSKADIRKILGPERYSEDLYEEEKIAGVAVGLAWTSVGGDILFIEASLSKGKGTLQLTGNLGDVMKESASTALSFLKAHTELLGLDQSVILENDIHIHVPEGAIPKDGPSAGITMLTALASAFTKRPVKAHLAMTGEITLRGKVLPVGGIKEKILAAKRSGIKEIILCKENKKHIEEINAQYIKGLTFHYVDRMAQVLDLALVPEKVEKIKAKKIA
ncbi:MAG: endopeptidase La [Saprospiraceae bacterium]